MEEGPPSKRCRVVLLLVFVMGGVAVEGCWEEERVGLLQLKSFFCTRSDPFINHRTRKALYNWMDVDQVQGPDHNSDCCKWEGVECDATTGRVIALHLSNRFDLNDLDRWVLSGGFDLNASLFLPFQHLNSLHLSGVGLAACLPNHGFEKLAWKLKKLEVLDLSLNKLNDSNILSSFLEFSSLKSLDLSDNHLSGPIHTDGLSTKLSSIENLDLSDNYYLNDGILSALSAFPLLKHLDLSDNQITGSNGSMFKGLSRLTNLETLYLGGNFELGNNILSHLGNLSSLKILDLEYCALEGTIRIQELNHLINLKELYLSGNFIESFGSFQEDERQSAGLINLEVLSLTLNIINNNILSSLGPFSKSLKHLDINKFDIDGSIDIEDARKRGLKNLKSADLVAVDAANNSVLPQSPTLFPSLKFLHFNGYDDEETVIIGGFRNLTILEELFLGDSFLHTDFLEDIRNLTSLRVLSLSDCRSFSGSLSIQGICDLRSLEELDISHNSLTGTLPDCFSNLKSLRNLHLSSNKLSGDLSMFSLMSHTSIESVDLSNNQFQIPSSLQPFFNHSKLKYFNGDNNNIFVDTELHSFAPLFQLSFISLSCCGNVGRLPKFLHHQHELQYVNLPNINLTDEFPSWLLENNTQLETLFLLNNSLSGHLKLPFHQSMKLLELDISNNFLDGHIPTEIGRYLPGLKFLNISRNSLVGGIPSSIGGMKLLEKLDLSNNRLSGIIPESLGVNCSFIIALILSNNSLQGQLFSSNFNLINLEQLQLASNNFTGVIPNGLANCSLLSTIDFGDNHFSGRIPQWLGNLSSLKEIIMLNNDIEGLIPMEFCELDKLEVLDLSMNNISGTLPPCFRPLRVNHVHLSRNSLRGSIPNSLCNSSFLVTLDFSYNQLSGNIPNCIGELLDLSYLVLGHNNLQGQIPNQFCQLNKLSLIDLSHNNLVGVIPLCLNVTVYDQVVRNSTLEPYNNKTQFGVTVPTDHGSIKLTTKSITYTYKGRILRFLSGIDLSANKLTGEIPHQMGNLDKIVLLNLSYNTLTGPIPSSFSNLSQIESLDLSYNNLSGGIPPRFVLLHFLAYFNVSYNNLSGKPPPRSAQFASDFDENGYWGNPLLCGEPLPKNCSKAIEPSSSNSTKEHRDDQEDGGFMDIESFFQTFGVSYIMVLLGIAAVLYINPYWRQAWLYFVERVITTCFYFFIDNLLPRQFRFYCI